MKRILHIRDKQERKYKRIFNETNDINLRIDIPFSIETGLKKEKCDWWKTHPFDPNNITSVHTIFNDDIGSNGVDAYNDISQ